MWVILTGSGSPESEWCHYEKSMYVLCDSNCDILGKAVVGGRGGPQDFCRMNEDGRHYTLV